MSGQNFGFAHLWAQGDAISHAVAILLLLMSIAAWYVILSKGWQHFRLRRHATTIEHFWQAPSLDEALALLDRHSAETPHAAVARRGQQAAGQLARQASGTHAPVSFGHVQNASEFLTRALRQGMLQGMARLEGGLTVLASVGSTAPFVGLFGTVWGIYHALLKIGSEGASGVEQIAAPVGEALVMTALGLAVAIPAVLAYNTLTRANRIVAAELDAFAHDLHAQLLAGPQPAKGAA